MTELLVSGKEANALDVAVVLDLTVDLVQEEGLNGIVELVFPEVVASISHSEVRPVGMLNSVKEAVVLCYPQAILESFKVDSRVKGVSGRVEHGEAISVVATVLLLSQVL